MKSTLTILSGLLAMSISSTVLADSTHHSKHHKMNCPVTWQQLKDALDASVKAAGGPSNGGLDFHMWGTVVNTSGIVCAVAKTGDSINDQWLGSRIISAQKANTANAFSLTHGLALSTANLWAATQPGGSLFGLQFSNPVDTKSAYRGNARRFGTSHDPLKGRRIGGVNVFGGGLALYNEEGMLVGAIGVSGDTSCADHNVAWRTRDSLGLDYVPAGVSPSNNDNIIFDVTVDGNTGLGVSAGGFGHVACGPDVETANAFIVGNCQSGDGPTSGCLTDLPPQEAE